MMEENQTLGCARRAEQDASLKGAERIAAYLKTLPDAPGVYRMLNAKGDVLYVGKAESLKKRVASYAQGGAHSNRIERMISETAEMIFVSTASEVEALLLEANLIKRLKPRYNVSYRDDKSFPNILLRTDHPFPQVLKHRGAKSRDGIYFGPFATAGAVNRTLNTLQRAFLLRSCSDSVFQGRTRPCLLYQIKRCSAPCVGRIDARAAMRALVAQAKNFLDRQEPRSCRTSSREQMHDASETDGLRARRAIARPHPRDEPHPLASGRSIRATFAEADVFALHRADGASLHPGVLLPRRTELGQPALFPAPRADDRRPAKCWAAFLGQFYDSRTAAPADPAVARRFRNARCVAEALSHQGRAQGRDQRAGARREARDHAGRRCRTRARNWRASRPRTRRSARCWKASPKPSGSTRRPSASRSMTTPTSRARTPSAR